MTKNKIGSTPEMVTVLDAALILTNRTPLALESPPTQQQANDILEACSTPHQREDGCAKLILEGSDSLEEKVCRWIEHRSYRWPPSQVRYGAENKPTPKDIANEIVARLKRAGIPGSKPRYYNDDIDIVRTLIPINEAFLLGDELIDGIRPVSGSVANRAGSTRKGPAKSAIRRWYDEYLANWRQEKSSDEYPTDKEVLAAARAEFGHSITMAAIDQARGAKRRGPGRPRKRQK